MIFEKPGLPPRNRAYALRIPKLRAMDSWTNICNLYNTSTALRVLHPMDGPRGRGRGSAGVRKCERRWWRWKGLGRRKMKAAIRNRKFYVYCGNLVRTSVCRKSRYRVEIRKSRYGVRRVLTGLVSWEPA